MKNILLGDLNKYDDVILNMGGSLEGPIGTVDVIWGKDDKELELDFPFSIGSTVPPKKLDFWRDITIKYGVINKSIPKQSDAFRIDGNKRFIKH